MTAARRSPSARRHGFLPAALLIHRLHFRLHRSANLFPVALLVLAVLTFLGLGAHQLDLPGLHYDEAREAGVNAMQLVTRQPLTAFRDAAVQVGPWQLPLMVQDYIGALNVLLAVPFLVLGGVSVTALRWLPLLTGAVTLILAWRVAWRLGGPAAASITAFLLAVNPSFVFWSRQGIFVTNLTALFFMASLLTGLRWWTGRRPRDLWLTAFLWGLGLYAKLLFAWAIGAMAAVAGLAWLSGVRRSPPGAEPPWLPWHPERSAAQSKDPPVRLEAARGPHFIGCTFARAPSTALTLALAGGLFLLPLVPLILFNLRTGGTFASIFGNLGQSYYGVNNRAYIPNLEARLGQLVVLLRGAHFWYLGELFRNPLAPWIAGGLVILAALAAAMQGRAGARTLGRVLLPVGLLALIIAQSAFTVSDLFISHFVLLLPLIPLAGGVAAATLLRAAVSPARARRLAAAQWKTPLLTKLARAAILAAVLAWAGGDLWTTLRYHDVLSVAGGYSGHSDAINDLAAYLDRTGGPAPVALDWGMEAPIRFLSVDRVQPVELFGYARLDAPDDGFGGRIAPYLAAEDTLYLAHMGEMTVFHGRVEALGALAAARGLTLREEARFAERSGRPLFVVYRAVKRS